MARSSEFVDYVTDLLDPLGPVQARAMFGGFGIYLHDLIFAVVIDDALFLKVDDAIRADFEARGLRPFTYDREGRKISMSYYQAPSGALDNAEELCRWARKAYGAATRAAAGKHKRSVRPKKRFAGKNR